jgi:hypothetical protein
MAACRHRTSRPRFVLSTRPATCPFALLLGPPFPMAQGYHDLHPGSLPSPGDPQNRRGSIGYHEDGRIHHGPPILTEEVEEWVMLWKR